MRFKSKRADGRSYRDLAVERLRDVVPGTVVSYEELGVAFDLNPKTELPRIRAAVGNAVKMLLKQYSIGIKNVAGKGYRVVPAREHMIAAGSHQSKAERQMNTALAWYEGAKLDEMTPAERKLHQGQHMLAQAIVSSHKHLNERINRIESLLQGGRTIEHDDDD
jgi:hypothetical protein